MPFRYLEDIATADVAFEAWGATVEDAFVAAADATMNVMVQDLASIVARERRPIRVTSDALDMLLFELLQELIYWKDAGQLLLRIPKVVVQRHQDHLLLSAEAYGEQLDPQRHDLIVDVKAVTLHRFRVEQTPEGWLAFVILDI